MQSFRKVNFSAFFTRFVMAFLPAICRAIYRDDHIAFGKSQNARYVFGFGFVGSLFAIFACSGTLLLFNGNEF